MSSVSDTRTVRERRQSQPSELGSVPSRLATLTGVQILGVGAYAPPNVVRNEDLAELGYDADWIIQRTGIRERRKVDDGTATSDLAIEASLRCLQQAQVSAAELDLIVVATMTPDTPTPSTACHLQRRLGATCPAMDLNAACAGFMYSMVTGMQFLKTGAAKKVLVVGADVMSQVVNPEDRKTYPLFGDGAGAALLGVGSDEQGLLCYTLGANGKGSDLLCSPAGGSRQPITQDVLDVNGQYLYMDGRPVFKWAVRLIVDSINEILSEALIAASEVDLVVLHQANARIIDAAISDFDFGAEKVVINLDRYGNTSAASIPIALDEVMRQGRLKRGDHVLMCGFGAGLTWGTALMRW